MTVTLHITVVVFTNLIFHPFDRKMQMLATLVSHPLILGGSRLHMEKMP
jgi:hypothetical protein